MATERLGFCQLKLQTTCDVQARPEPYPRTIPESYLRPFAQLQDVPGTALRQIHTQSMYEILELPHFDPLLIVVASGSECQRLVERIAGQDCLPRHVGVAAQVVSLKGGGVPLNWIDSFWLLPV